MTVTTLVVSTSVTISGHIITGGTAPTIAAGAGAGTSPTVSVTGNDQAGAITVTTGTSPAAGALATVTFAGAYGAAPHVVLTAVGDAAAGLQHKRWLSLDHELRSALATAPVASTTYTFNYWIAQ